MEELKFQHDGILSRGHQCSSLCILHIKLRSHFNCHLRQEVGPSPSPEDR